MPVSRTERREKLLRAAQSAVMKHGADVQLKQVATEAGLTPGAVLYHFRDIQTLLVEANRAGMERFYDALRAFEALANDHRLQWRRRNPPGEAMLFDNWRVLHGRTAYTGHRHLCGAYINHEDYESRLRLAHANGS